MHLKPQNGYLLCRQVNADSDSCLNGIYVHQEVIPEYEVVDIAANIEDKRFAVGDVIMTNSIPTKVRVDDDFFFFISASNVIGKCDSSDV